MPPTAAARAAAEQTEALAAMGDNLATLLGISVRIRRQAIEGGFDAATADAMGAQVWAIMIQGAFSLTRPAPAG